MSKNHLGYVIELVPVFILLVDISEERLEPRASRDSKIQGFGGKERFEIEQVVIVFVDNIREELGG